MPKRSLNVIPWFKDGLSFTCTQCGNCCTGGPGYVWISDVEIDRLAEHLQITRAVAIRKYCRVINGRVSLKEKRDHRGEYPCIFLSEEEVPGPSGKKVLKRGCTIYPVRPLQCRTWPFWKGILEDHDAWDATGTKCPGLNKGRKYPLEQIVALRDAKDWPQNNKTPTSARK